MSTPRAALIGMLFAGLCDPTQADIYRWDNGQVIPGTEGITPGPGVELNGMELEYALLSSLDLSGANFDSANLTRSRFGDASLRGASLRNADLESVSFRMTKQICSDWDCYYTYHATDLTDADLTGANLTNSYLDRSVLTSAIFDNAIVNRAYFSDTTSSGFTAAQLYSTASYRAKDLAELRIGSNDLSSWDFAGQNLRDSYFMFSDVSFADFREADLTAAAFRYAQLEGARLDNASVQFADLSDTTRDGFNTSQLYATSSYRSGQLQGIALEMNDLSDWDFAGQDMADASFRESRLFYTNFRNATLRSADYFRAVLNYADLTDADLTDANLESAFLTETIFNGAIIENARLIGVTRPWLGFSREQLYSTASYRAKNLKGVAFDQNDLSGWDFRGQFLVRSSFTNAQVADSDFSMSDTRGAVGLDLVNVLTRNTILPNGTVAGLHLLGADRIQIRNFDPLGMSPIEIKVEDGLAVDHGAQLAFQFDDTAWNSTISFEAGIPVIPGGELMLDFAVGADAAAQTGTSFQLFDWTGVEPIGEFAYVESRYWWDLSELYTTGVARLASAQTGDTNGDAIVDIVDLNHVRNYYGGGPERPGDTIPFNGGVDITDLNAVRNNFGAGAPRAVPEPAGWWLALLVGGWGLGAARRRCELVG